MSIVNSNHIQCKPGTNKKVLLVLLPFWSPQIPPLGIACLKSFLQGHHIKVKTVDVNIEDEARKILKNYYDTLEGYIPVDKIGNLRNIGNNVLYNHMMAHINYKKETEYIELVKILVKKTFFTTIDARQVIQLSEIVHDFYQWLEKYFIDLLAKEMPDVLGLSVYRGTLPASVFAFRLTRQKHPHIKTVMGGPIFSQSLDIGSPNFEYFLERTRDFIDKIIIGEGEVLFLRYLMGELPESQRVYTLKSTDEAALDIRSAAAPDFSDFDTLFYPYLSVYVSRSCPFQCKFCAETVYWGKYRKKSAAQIVEELMKLYEKYRFQLFLMCDSLLNPVITNMSKELIRADKVVYWDGYLRVDKEVCNIENTILWRQGGFYRTRLGIESGSQRVLDLINKKVNIEQIKSAISNLAYAGIKTTTYWIIGYPGETEEDFQQTLDLLEEFKDDIYEADCNPFVYFLTGQVNSSQWIQMNKSVPLYPENARDMLMIQAWGLDCYPPREVTYKRLNRFIEHCNALGIHNPYSLHDIYKADEHWKKMHKNAVPNQLEFIQARDNNIYISESRNIKKITFGKSVFKNNDNVDWGF